MLWLRWTTLAVAALFMIVILVRVLNPLPSLSGREQNRAVDQQADTLIGPAIRDAMAQHSGQSGLMLLQDGREAFASRVLLARGAQRSIDAQYYIWRDDLTGGLLFDELQAAADRGVRVRLLLDDNTTAGLDPIMARLDAHPNIEIRLFNPFTVRGLRVVSWIADFNRLNRRMHNKSFTADNEATIVGGRNVGDEYFGAGEGALFVDLDALAVGPVVQEVSDDFDRYWNSESAYPAATILGPESKTAQLSRADRRTPAAAVYLQSVGQSEILNKLRKGSLPLTWAPVMLVSDDPAKALGRLGPGNLLITRLEETLGTPRKRLRLVAGYFVPTNSTVKKLKELRARGIAVEVVTNSLESTDVPVVHSGYAGDRIPLLRAGVRLWELKRRAGAASPTRRWWAGGSGSGVLVSGVPQGAGQALHAKTFTVDGERLFVGSFNLDPRSARLNTELGFVIESQVLASFVDHSLTSALPYAAYEILLNEQGNLEWLENGATDVIVHQSEPGTNFWSRAFVAILSRLPVEWLL